MGDAIVLHGPIAVLAALIFLRGAVALGGDVKRIRDALTEGR